MEINEDDYYWFSLDDLTFNFTMIQLNKYFGGNNNKAIYKDVVLSVFDDLIAKEKDEKYVLLKKYFEEQGCILMKENDDAFIKEFRNFNNNYTGDCQMVYPFFLRVERAYYRDVMEDLFSVKFTDSQKKIFTDNFLEIMDRGEVLKDTYGNIIDGIVGTMLIDEIKNKTEIESRYKDALIKILEDEIDEGRYSVRTINSALKKLQK